MDTFKHSNTNNEKAGSGGGCGVCWRGRGGLMRIIGLKGEPMMKSMMMMMTMMKIVAAAAVDYKNK